MTEPGHSRSLSFRDAPPKNQNLWKVAFSYPMRASGFHFFQKCLYIFRPNICDFPAKTMWLPWQYLAPNGSILAPNGSTFGSNNGSLYDLVAVLLHTYSTLDLEFKCCCLSTATEAKSTASGAGLQLVYSVN